MLSTTPRRRREETKEDQEPERVREDAQDGEAAWIDFDALLANLCKLLTANLYDYPGN